MASDMGRFQMEEISEDWLERFNERMSAEGVHYSQRPFRAMSEWSRARNCVVTFPSPTADKVLKWFYQHSPEGSHAVGSVFTGAFYFDSYFWPVHIPLAYGRVQLNALDFLGKMPEVIKRNLTGNSQALTEYVLLWADALDYAYGFDDLTKMGVCSPFALEMLRSADRNLRATVELLIQANRPNPAAMETARMSTEMFLKAYLASHGSLDSEKARKDIGHNLLAAAEECLAVGRDREFELIRKAVEMYPPIKARYEGRCYPPTELSRAYTVAQISGVILTRSLTDRDSRSQLQPSPSS